MDNKHHKHFHDNHHIVNDDNDSCHHYDRPAHDYLDGSTYYDNDSCHYYVRTDDDIYVYDDGTTHDLNYCTAYDDYHDGIAVHDDHGRPYVVSRSCPVHDAHHVLRAPASASSNDSSRDDDLFHNFYDEFNVHYNHDNDHHNVAAAIDHVNTTDYDNLRPRDHLDAGHYHDIANDYLYPPPDDYYDRVANQYYEGADNHLFSTHHNYD